MNWTSTTVRLPTSAYRKPLLIRRERTMTMKHYGDVSKINGVEVEPFCVKVTSRRFEGGVNGGMESN